MPLNVSSKHPYTRKIDGEDVLFLIARLDTAQVLAFDRDFMKYANRTRKGQELKDKLQEAGAAVPEEDLDKAFETEEQAREFISESLLKYVLPAPGAITVDSLPVETMEKFLSLFAARIDVLSDLLAAISLENHLDADQKKILRSVLASANGSPIKTEEPNGAIPERTAHDVVEQAIAANEGATAPGSPTSSGTAAP